MNLRERRRQMFMTPDAIERERAESVLLQRPSHKPLMDDYRTAFMLFAVEHGDVFNFRTGDAVSLLALCDYIEERAPSESPVLMVSGAIRWSVASGIMPHQITAIPNGQKLVRPVWLFVTDSADPRLGDKWRFASLAFIPWRLFDVSPDWRRTTIRFQGIFSLYSWLAAGIECLRRCGRNPRGELFRKIRPTLFPQEA